MATMLITLGVVCGALAGVLAFDIDTKPFDQPGSDTPDGAGNDYGSIVGAQEAELRGAYQSRSFESRLSTATSNESRAAIVAAETDRIEATLDALETQRAGSTAIDDANRTEITSFVAQSHVLERRFERVNRSVESLSAAVRSSNNLSEERFDALRERIESLTTPEMVELATNVAGSDVGDELNENEDDARADGSDDDDAADQDDDAENEDGPDDSDDSDDDDPDETESDDS